MDCSYNINNTLQNNTFTKWKKIPQSQLSTLLTTTRVDQENQVLKPSADKQNSSKKHNHNMTKDNTKPITNGFSYFPSNRPRNTCHTVPFMNNGNNVCNVSSDILNTPGDLMAYVRGFLWRWHQEIFCTMQGIKASKEFLQRLQNMYPFILYNASEKLNMQTRVMIAVVSQQHDRIAQDKSKHLRILSSLDEKNITSASWIIVCDAMFHLGQYKSAIYTQNSTMYTTIKNFIVQLGQQYPAVWSYITQNEGPYVQFLATGAVNSLLLSNGTTSNNANSTTATGNGNTTTTTTSTTTTTTTTANSAANNDTVPHNVPSTKKSHYADKCATTSDPFPMTINNNEHMETTTTSSLESYLVDTETSSIIDDTEDLLGPLTPLE
jgi:predicted SnoaL-like aldol condensation-catalyzing enzyme